MKFLDLKGIQLTSHDIRDWALTKASANCQDTKVYIIRRISGHLRLEGHLWNFVFLCDPFQDCDKSGFVRDIPGDSMPPMTQWLSGAVDSHTPKEHLDRLSHDGYGLVVKILRDIKSSWKLMLGEMEDFLEELVSVSILRHLAYYMLIKLE